jgi:hypothetical protein
MNSVSTYVVACLLFVTPGVLVIRKLALSVPERVVLGPGLSIAAILPVVIVLGLVSALQPWVVMAVALAANASAVRFPLTGAPFGSDDEPRPPTWTMLAPVAVFAVVAGVQAFRPPLLHPFDATAVWAPLAESAASTGTIVPDWVPTMSKGISPGVALLAGPPSAMAGHLVESFALLVHPAFAALAVLMAMLLARRLAGRVGGVSLTAFTLMMATPLLSRAIVFHDDLINGFFTSLAVYLALRAVTPTGWFLVGLIAAAALSMKYLGIVAAVLVLLVLAVRRAPRRAVLMTCLGLAAALPWHVANLVRLGDPVFPFFKRLTGGLDAERQFLIEQQERFLSRSAFGDVLLTGRLALVLMMVGIVLGLAWLRRSTLHPPELWLALGGFLVTFLLVWNASGYGARHFLGLYPIYAAVAAVGFAPIPTVLSHRRIPIRLQATTLAASLLFTSVASLTVFNLEAERRGTPVRFDRQTGAESILRGKWIRVNRALHPPDDPFASFGDVAGVWHWLNTAGDPTTYVLSFDTRRYYIRQPLLAGDDLQALRLYRTGDADRQHAAMARANIGYVMATPFDANFEALYELGPWKYLKARPDLYRLAFSNRRFSVYAVVGVVQ